MALSASEVTALETARANYCTRLEEMSRAPKMDYDVDGQRFNHTQYQRMLLEAIRDIERQLSESGSATGPISVNETIVAPGM